MILQNKILAYMRGRPYCVSLQELSSHFEVNTEELAAAIAVLAKERIVMLRFDHSSMNPKTFSSRGEIIYERFMDMLFTERPVRRDVGYYAKELCVTPKYLSIVVKKYSDKTAYQWIKKTIVQEIEDKLIYSEDSIKEIAFLLDFPSISFMGKFFKSMTGVSPMFYRKLHSLCNTNQ